jgi:hypothetical protein
VDERSTWAWEELMQDAALEDHWYARELVEVSFSRISLHELFPRAHVEGLR